MAPVCASYNRIFSPGGAATSNIFDIFTDGEAPYTGIRARYEDADGTWNARGVQSVPEAQASVLLPISGSLTAGWRIALKEAGVAGNAWRLFRTQRLLPILGGRSSTVIWGLRFTSTRGAAADNGWTVRLSGPNFGFSTFPANKRITIGVAGTPTRDQVITQVNASLGSHGSPFRATLDQPGTGNVLFETTFSATSPATSGGADDVAGEPISLTISAQQINFKIADTDTLTEIRAVSSFVSSFADILRVVDVTVEGVVDEDTDVFAVPANDPGVAFSGGVDGKTGVVIDEPAKLIDVYYDAADPLEDIFLSLDDADMEPLYRGGALAADLPEDVGWTRPIGPITSSAAGDGNTFDVFADGGIPYEGIRARYGAADGGWSARGIQSMPGVQASVFLPISGTPGAGWRFTFEETLEIGAAGNAWRLLRFPRSPIVPAVAASVEWEYIDGRFITITVVAAGTAGNADAINAFVVNVGNAIQYVRSDDGGARYDIRYTPTLTVAEIIVGANAAFSDIVFSPGTGYQATDTPARVLGAPSYVRFSGGTAEIPGETISATVHSFPSTTFTLRIAATDTLADIRSEIISYLISEGVVLSTVGVLDEATDTFDVPAVDPGLNFAGGVNVVPLGASVDEASKIIDVTYDPGTNTLAEMLAEMEAAGLQPEYRGNVDGTESPEPVGWVRTVGPITATEAAAASNIFDVFEDGEAPYVGIRGSYSAADLDWSVRGLPVVANVQSSVLLPISGSVDAGWRITLKETFERGVLGNAHSLFRTVRPADVAAIAAAARNFGITFTADVAGVHGNGWQFNIYGKATGVVTVAVHAGNRIVTIEAPNGTTRNSIISAVNPLLIGNNVLFTATLTPSFSGTEVIDQTHVSDSTAVGGVDVITDPIQILVQGLTFRIVFHIRATDTLQSIRATTAFSTILLPFVDVAVEGLVDEATDTFDIPTAPDAGVPFAGGVNEIPLGVSIDLASKLIDLRYDPAAHTLADLFSEMETAALSPAYRGGAAATDAPEATGWVRTVGPITAAGAAVGTGSTTPALTRAQIKQKYEANANTNAFTNAEQTKLGAIETGATKDQTGSEIKTAYEGESDTNAFTNAQKTKLDATLSTSDLLDKIKEGSGIAIDRLTTPGEITVSSIGGVDLPVVYLGRPTTVADGALTFAKPTGYPTTGRYPVGTLLSFISGYFTPFENSNTNLRVIIGTDSYTFEDVNTGSLYYRDLVTDTAHLLVATGSGTLQLLAPPKPPTGSEIKAAYEGESDTNAFTNTLKSKLDGIAAAATAVSIADVLGAIFAGTNITIDDTVDGRITIASTAGSSYPAGAGSVTGASFAEASQSLTFVVTGGSNIVVPLGIFITASELVTALTPYTKVDGTVAFTGVVAGVTPTDDAHLSTKKYVDDADVLKASLSGATFTGETRGLTPVNDPDFATKAYVDAAVAGTTPPSVRSELIYYGQILAANAADLAAAITYAETIDVSTLDMEDATVAGHNITVGPAAAGDFFLILAPATHDLLTLVNLGTQGDERNTYSRSANARNDLGTPSEQYNSYVLGPLNPGVSISYRLTLVE